MLKHTADHRFLPPAGAGRQGGCRRAHQRRTTLQRPSQPTLRRGPPAGAGSQPAGCRQLLSRRPLNMHMHRHIRTQARLHVQTRRPLDLSPQEHFRCRKPGSAPALITPSLTAHAPCKSGPAARMGLSILNISKNSLDPQCKPGPLRHHLCASEEVGQALDPYLSARAWPHEAAMADGEGTRPGANGRTCTISDDSCTDLCVIVRMLHVHACQGLASTLHVELDRLCSGHPILNQGVGQALGCLAGPNHAQTLLESVLGAAGAAVHRVSVREHSLSPCNVGQAARQQLHKALSFPQALLGAIEAQVPHFGKGFCLGAAAVLAPTTSLEGHGAAEAGVHQVSRQAARQLCLALQCQGLPGAHPT